MTSEDENSRLVALRNARSIDDARERTEEELLRAKQALEMRSQELVRSLAIMQATLEATSDGIMVSDNERNVTGFNQQYVAMGRLSNPGLQWEDHLHPCEAYRDQLADSGHYLARLDEIYRDAPAESHDILHLVDGRVFERTSRIQFLDGRNVGRVWSYRDITERKRAEAERDRLLAHIGENEERYRLGLDASATGVWAWDIVSGRITWSARVAEIYDMRMEDFDGSLEMFARHVHPEDSGRVMQAITASIETDVPYRIEFRIVQPGGATRWIFTSGKVIRDADGRPLRMIGATRDITERKAADNELQQAARRKDEFLALLAHELRNPLAPIRNGLQVMRLADGNADAIEQARKMMDRQLGHLVRLVVDLLDVSRIGQNKMERRKARILLRDVVENAVETARPVIEAAGHALHIALPEAEVVVDGDLTRLAQVLSNLLTNSAKYTRPGGSIRLDCVQHDGEVEISVRDTGIGIPVGELAHVFDMFSQVDRSMERATGGLGIGLALVKGLVEMHGGTVAAISDGPDTGSTFTIRLPLPGVVLSTSRSDAMPAHVQTRKKVLVVDDSEDAAHSMAMVLRSRGNDVRVAGDGVEAVAAARDFLPDVILMDVGMPRLNGHGAARLIREQQGSHRPVIIALTGWGQESDRIQSRDAGFDGHLVKPVDLPELERLVMQLLHAQAMANA